MVLLYVLSFIFLINAFMWLSEPDGTSYFVGSLLIGAIFGALANGLRNRANDRKRQLDLKERLVRLEEQRSAPPVVSTAPPRGPAAPLQSYVTTSSTIPADYERKMIGGQHVDMANSDSAAPDAMPAYGSEDLDVGKWIAILAFVVVLLVIVAAIASR